MFPENTGFLSFYLYCTVL